MSPVIGFATKLNNHPDLPDIFRYAWLEGTVKAKIMYIEEAPDWNNFDTWPAGRLFGDKGEYRWQRNTDQTGGKIHAVLILDEGDLPEGFDGRLEIEKNEKSSMILWGKWIDLPKDLEGNPDVGSVFYARDIPKTQTYPIPPEQTRETGKTPRLVVQKYRHKQKESEEFKGEFIRCVHLCMRSESEEEDDV